MSRTLDAPVPTPKSALPPGPNSPAWRQLVRFAGDPLGLFDECHSRFGDAFTLDIAGYGRFVMLSDPEAVREVFRGDPEALHSGEANEILSATVGALVGPRARRRTARAAAAGPGPADEGRAACGCSSTRCGSRRSRPSAPGRSARRSRRCRRYGGSPSGSSSAPAWASPPGRSSTPSSGRSRSSSRTAGNAMRWCS